MMSTLTSAAASGSNRAADTPGRSITPSTVIFATSTSVARPLTLFLISVTVVFIPAPSWISVPGASTKLEATMMGMP